LHSRARLSPQTGNQPPAVGGESEVPLAETIEQRSFLEADTNGQPSSGHTIAELCAAVDDPVVVLPQLFALCWQHRLRFDLTTHLRY
jgi:hypothetical protein